MTLFTFFFLKRWASLYVTAAVFTKNLVMDEIAIECPESLVYVVDVG